MDQDSLTAQYHRVRRITRRLELGFFSCLFQNAIELTACQLAPLSNPSATTSRLSSPWALLHPAYVQIRLLLVGRTTPHNTPCSYGLVAPANRGEAHQNRLNYWRGTHLNPPGFSSLPHTRYCMGIVYSRSFCDATTLHVYKRLIITSKM